MAVGTNSGKRRAHVRRRGARGEHHRWRPLLNGYSSYWPAGFPERMALAMRLPDPDALAALRRETGLTNVVVDVGYLDTRARDGWRALADSGGSNGLRAVARDGDVLLFQVGMADP